jgi:transglutaminase superfamily protein/coenzyme PQQ synthesis protein D (PqqD)
MTTSQTLTKAGQPDLLSLVAGKHRDGIVVLSAAHDRIFKLNGVGALTWTIIEQSPGALSVDDLVETLSNRFHNRELREDTTRFVNNLLSNGLLEVVNDERLQKTYRVAHGISATTSTTIGTGVLPQEEAPRGVASTVAQSPAGEISPAKWETLTAFFALLAFDLVLRLRGFEALIRKVEAWPIREPRNSDPEICRRVCAIVTRAQVYYPRKAMCLQHSAVVTCLLRRRGVPAQMVLAAQEFPPKAHAWVDLGGTVVNDSQQVKTRYRELRRI